jgi:hypothetical protein
MPRSTQSKECYDWILGQFRSCLEQHTSCRGFSDPVLPTRVLDLDISDGYVRVVETRGMHGKYVALSHCWGKPEDMTCKLEATTFSHYTTTGIPLESLPRTFRDAVDVTKRLGVRYLWIDSLCIIQPSKQPTPDEGHQDWQKDWERESALMCSVYSNSYLTLAAASGTGCQDGLFFANPTVEIKGTGPDGRPSQLFAREAAEHDVNWLPLFSRAWTFQELLLSPRTVFFGRNEPFWRCIELQSCFCSGTAVFEDTGDQIPKLRIRNGPGSLMTSRFESPWEWHKLVQTYSRKALTYETDRAAAIQGLSDYVSTWRRGKYLHGLWDDTLAVDLLWENSEPLDENMIGIMEECPGGGVHETWMDKWMAGIFYGRAGRSHAHGTFPSWSWLSYTRSEVSWVLSKQPCLYSPGVSLITRLEPNPDGTCGGQTSKELVLKGFLVYVPRRTLWGMGRGPEGFKRDHGISKDFEGDVYSLRILRCSIACASLALVCVDEERQLYKRVGIFWCWMKRFNSRRQRQREIGYFGDVHPYDQYGRERTYDRFPRPWWEPCEGFKGEEKTIWLV